MPSIYVSSTYQDLAQYRSAVFEAVRRLKHVPVGMEDYSSGSQPPLEKCLSDVRESQAYIGIIGWKYGSLPPGQDFSFTELEYRQAIDIGIPRFVFICSENWPQTLRDTDIARIESFRTSIKEAQVVRTFGTVEQLKFEVVSSLSHWMPGYQLPPLLHWHCDRDEQYEDISVGITATAGSTGGVQPPGDQVTRPVVLFAHAEQPQALNKFVHCFHDKATTILQLPSHYGLFWREIQWPLETSLSSFRSVLLRRLEKAFAQDAHGKLESLAARLDKRPETVVLHTRVYCDEWHTERAECLVSACQLWQQLQLRERTLPAILFVTLEYRKADSFFHRWKVDRRNKEIRASVGRLTPAVCGQSFTKIRELEDVLRYHAEEWGNRSDVQTIVGGADLTDDIGKVFGDRPRMPMRLLGEQLLNVLQNRVSRRRVA
jgi:hypothetical protein